ncbi:MAG: FG-GAP-like repeat-containing protein [Flavobacteriales bacterium]
MKDHSFVSFNEEQNMHVLYRTDGFDLDVTSSIGQYRTSLSLEGIGRGHPEFTPGEPLLCTVDKGQLEVDHGAFQMVYSNAPMGMRHDLIVNDKPSGEGVLEAFLRISGDLLALQVGEGEVVFHCYDVGSMALVPLIRYNGLHVWDATGRTLGSKMELRGDQLVLSVQDEHAIYPVTIDPVSSTADLVLPGSQTGENFGYSVATAGDVNGDGYSDILVGSPNWNTPFTNGGRVQLFLGSAGGIAATAAWTVQGPQANARLGFSVSSAGDLNGDGYSDVAIGVPGLLGRGAVVVYLGSASGLGTSASFTLLGDSQNGCEFGWSVALAGDVNGDGYSDLLVGAPKYTNSGTAQGKAYCYHGAASSMNLGWTFTGTAVNAQFGYSVAGAGDLNGDGISDVAIGAPYQPKFPGTNNGAVHVFRGNVGTGLNATAGSVLSGVGNANFGYCISSAGDMNGDGYADLLIGAPGTASGNGAAHLYLGTAAASMVPPTVSSTVTGSGGERLGNAVSLAGDVNGDGYADVIMGSPNSATDKGNVRIYKGGPSVQFNASHLYWTRTGSIAGAYLGAAVATGGDVNGDGISDLLLGTPGQAGTGVVSIFHGEPDPPSTTIQWSSLGTQNNGFMGRSVASAGDVNGDGYSDVLIGASGMDGAKGRAMLYLGSASGLSATPAWTTYGENAQDQFGYCVASAGDVNGDGYSDVLVGAASWPNYAWTGKAYLYLGGSSGLSLTPAWTLTGNLPDDRVGYALSSAGDVNGDGYSDVAVGAYMYNSGQGRAYVFHGSAGGLASTPDWVGTGDPQSFYAASISLAGDVNGDGYDDLVVGAPLHDLAGGNNFGAAFVYHGSPAGLSPVSNWSAFGEVAGDQFGESVSIAGDVNGDGYSDVVVGAYMHTSAGQASAGRAYVFHGAPTAGLEAVPHTVIDASMSLPDAHLGISVCSAGDVNGDGFSDVLIGAPRQAFLYPDQGRASIHLGSAMGVTASEDWIGWGPAANARMGNAVALAGDVNGDGYSDVVVGASDRNLGAGYEGAAYLFSGGGTGGLSMRTYQYRSNLTTPVRTSNGTFEAACDWGIGQWTRSALGRSKVKLAWEYIGHGPGMPSGVLLPNNSTDVTGISGSWHDSGLSGVLIKQAITGPMGTSHPAWRARVKHHPATALDGRPYGRWFVQGLHDLQVPSLKTNLMECGPLPVTLLGSSVECENGQVLLEWTTATEQDCAEFRVMRSADGVNWQVLLSMPCSGNSSQNIHYRTVDPLPVTQGLSYYRLDQYDINGTTTSFPVMVHVPCGMDLSLIAWPNPVTDQLYVSLTSSVDPNETVRAKVLDMSGREIADHAVRITGGSVGELSGLEALRSGPYLVRLYSSKRGVLGQLRMVRM